MKFTLYHNKNFLNYTFKTDKITTVPVSELEKVADVLFDEWAINSNNPDYGALDKVFMLTNNINDYWWKNNGVIPMEIINPQYRSTSVGDVIYDHFSHKYFLCCDSGWKEIKIER